MTALLVFISLAQLPAQKRKYPKVTVQIDINHPIKESFEYMVPMDLEHIFHPYKNLPGIDSTSNKEPWYTPGMQRTVYFDDGSTSQEYLLTLTPHSGFTYQVNDFTSALRKIVKQINGSWTFEETSNGNTHIEWTYEFVPKHFLARFLINTMVKKRIQTPMNNALNIMKEELESGNLYPYKRRVGNW